MAKKGWNRVETGARQPATRFGHAVVFDVRRRRLVMLGGQGRGFYSDVWAFDVAMKQWARLGLDDAGPLRRYGHSAVLDSIGDRRMDSRTRAALTTPRLSISRATSEAISPPAAPSR